MGRVGGNDAIGNVWVAAVADEGARARVGAVRDESDVARERDNRPVEDVLLEVTVDQHLAAMHLRNQTQQTCSRRSVAPRFVSRQRNARMILEAQEKSGQGTTGRVLATAVNLCQVV